MMEPLSSNLFHLISLFHMHITPLTADLLIQHQDSYLATLTTLSPPGEHTPESLVTCLDRMNAQGTMVFVAIDEQS